MPDWLSLLNVGSYLFLVIFAIGAILCFVGVLVSTSQKAKQVLIDLTLCTVLGAAFSFFVLAVSSVLDHLI